MGQDTKYILRACVPNDGKHATRGKIELMTKIMSMPVSKVEWVHRDTLRANNYNPNNVFTPEMKLLRTSLLEDGWTLPLVVREDGEIVDGFHRWTLSADKEVFNMTDGLVPIVRLANVDKSHQVASTIRYNRARGVHHVLKMSDIVRDLKDNQNQTDAEIARTLGMELLEVELLYERGNMLKRAGKDKFGKGWQPK